MKRFISALFLIVLLLSLLAGCAPVQSNNQKVSIVATVFPEYDWLRQLLGSEQNDVELTLLLNNGVDLHSFQPGADDIVKISSCDMFVYVGGESDQWVDKALAESVNKNMTVVSLVDALGDKAKTETLVEGMESEEEEEDAPDEHVWLSPRNAIDICKVLAQKLCNLLPTKADSIQANLTAYTEKLSALDNRYTEMAKNAKRSTILVADRFPFRYLADDYNLTYFAAFSGCSAESEASFETVTFLAQKTKELALPVVLTTETSDQKIAKTVIETTKENNVRILTLNSMQSSIPDGTDYLSIMEQNFETLKAALN